MSPNLGILLTALTDLDTSSFLKLVLPLLKVRFFGITGELVTVKSKQRSQRCGIYVRELYNSTVGDTAFVVEKDALDYITHARHFAGLDNLLFRYGRVLEPDLDEIINVQVVALDTDPLGSPRGLLVCPRGQIDKPYWIQVGIWQFQIASKLEFFLDFGVGESKARHSSITRWGIAMNKRVGKTQDIHSLIGTQKTHPNVMIDFTEEVPHLDCNGEFLHISAEDYLNTEVFGAIEAAPVVTTKGTTRASKKGTKASKKSKAPKIKAAQRPLPAKKSKAKKVKPVPVKKKLFPKQGINEPDSESDVDSDSDFKAPVDVFSSDDPSSSSDEESSSDDDIDNFKVAPSPSGVSRHRSSNNRSADNKYLVRMTDYQLERHDAIFDPNLFRGKWPSLSIEARADRVYHAERKRGVYEVTKTAVQSFLQGNMGSDPISYYMPYEKVPLSEKQCLPMEKWTVTVAPRKWAKTMKDLDGCFYVVNEMAHIYLRTDVANAVTVIYKKVNYWTDTNFPVHAVNAYRDLYCGALSGIVDAAVDGDTGMLSPMWLVNNVHPTLRYTFQPSPTVRTVWMMVAHGQLALILARTPRHPTHSRTPLRTVTTRIKEVA